MCKSVGRCIAITFIVIGVLVLAFGILTLVAPHIIDCDDLDIDIHTDFDIDIDDDFGDFAKNFCTKYLGTAKTVGIVVTTIGGVMVLVGIIMLCLMKSKPKNVVNTIPMVVPAQQQPNYPNYNHQYTNPMMFQQQQHQPRGQQLPGYSQYS